jgi:hypothetical protein
VLLTTIRRFKGLKADAVVVTDVPNPKKTSYFSTANFYVGCSRAKHLLVILATEKGIETDFFHPPTVALPLYCPSDAN